MRAGFGLVVTLLAASFAGCGQVIGLRGDYELASDGGAEGGGAEEGGAEGGGAEAGAQSDAATDDTGVPPNNEAGVPDSGAEDASLDTGSDAPPIDPGTVGPPRQRSPLSSVRVTTQTPRLAWELASGTDGAVIEVCADRACTTIEQTFPVPGSSGPVPQALAAGVHYWRAHGTLLGVVGTKTSPTWQFSVGHRSATKDSSWGAIPDFNGDGLAEVVVGGYSENGVDVFPGGKLGPVVAQRVSLTNPSPADGDKMQVPAVAGDVDGDGFVDLLVGAPCVSVGTCSAAASRAYVFSGGPGGIASGQKAARVLASPNGSGSQFGITTATAGDINGDGYADILVGDWVNPHGYVFVYYGSATGVGAAPSITLHTGFVEEAFVSACDVNADGYTDVVASGRNAVMVYVGGAAGPSDSTMFALNLPSDITSAQTADYGLASSVGDLDGDGVCDIATGAGNAPLTSDGGAGPGRVYVYRGQNGPGLRSFQWALTGPAEAASFGTAVRFVGDMNGDGFDDLVAAAAYGSGAGRAYSFTGGPSGVSDASRVPLSGSGGGFGYQIAGAGDIDGDGVADALVGSLGGGYVNAYFGHAPSGISDASLVQLTHWDNMILAMGQ
jgi:hypothetical protein